MKKNNFKYLPLLLLLLTFMITGCDKLEEDILPDKTQVFDFPEDYYLVPNTSLTLNLSKGIKSSRIVKLAITKTPENGVAVLKEEGNLFYRTKNNFNSGNDQLKITAFNSHNLEIGTATINFIMVSDTTGLPCTNTALGDYAETLLNTPVIINVISNDGVCKNEINSAEIKISKSPSSGTAQVEENKIVYAPNVDYSGVDELSYILEVVDSNDLRLSTMAIVEINVENSECTILDAVADKVKVYPDSSSYNIPYVIEVLGNDIYCTRNTLEIEIVKNTSLSGASSYFDDSFNLNYKAPSTPQSDTIIYRICHNIICDEAEVFFYAE